MRIFLPFAKRTDYPPCSPSSRARLFRGPFDTAPNGQAQLEAASAPDAASRARKVRGHSEPGGCRR
jgi:hypothetical protein